jgi:hypothetical protein
MEDFVLLPTNGKAGIDMLFRISRIVSASDFPQEDEDGNRARILYQDGYDGIDSYYTPLTTRQVLAEMESNAYANRAD